MTKTYRNTILASAALALVAFQAPAFASGDRDSGLGYSHTAGFASETAGTVRDNQSVAFQASSTQGLNTADSAVNRGYGNSKRDAADFNTTRDWR